VFRTEARTCKHCQPAGRADAVPARAPAAIVIATTAATATSLSTPTSLDPYAQRTQRAHVRHGHGLVVRRVRRVPRYCPLPGDR
jgi:hypothetical protein